MKGIFKVLSNQAAHSSRLLIVRGVVAGGEYVRPQHDAALNFRAESFRSGFPKHGRGILRFHPHHVTHAVVAAGFKLELASAVTKVR